MIGGLGMQELLVILAIALLLFGGKRLPEVGKNLGKAIRGFRQAEEETRKELRRAAEEGKTEKEEKEKEQGKETEKEDHGKSQEEKPA